jgi:hypothetical protein
MKEGTTFKKFDTYMWIEEEAVVAPRERMSSPVEVLVVCIRSSMSSKSI